MKLWLATLVLIPFLLNGAETRDSKVISDRANVTSGGKWIYNDLAKGFNEARSTGKPLLVVFRCIP